MNNDNTNKKFWQKISKIYTVFMNRNNLAYDSVCEILDKYIDKEKQVLELACGTGQISFRMAGKSNSWIATDYSENMIREAEKRKEENFQNSNVSFEQQDATRLNYDDNKFDIVVIANALHIMPDPGSAIKEIKRVLKDDGILFAPTFVYEKGYSKLLIWFMERIGFKTYHKWNKDEFIKFIKDFELIVVEDIMVNAKPLDECIVVAGKK